MAKNDPSYIDALKKYAHADNAKSREVFAGLKSESDRSLVVIAGSLVEDTLGDLLKSKMRPPANSKERGSLWGAQGLLGTFSAKTRLAFALRMIDEKERDQLDILREMRNACAHSQMPIDFDTPELRVASAHFIDLSNDPEVKDVHDSKKGRRLAFYIEALNLSTGMQRRVELRRNALAPLIGKSPPPSNPPGPQKTNEK